MLRREHVSQLKKIASEENVLASKEDLNAYSYDATLHHQDEQDPGDK